VHYDFNQPGSRTFVDETEGVLEEDGIAFVTP
jgi:hypothetical protein